MADMLVPGLMALRNNGDGTFGAPVVTQITLTPTRIAGGDFDGDGRQDMTLTTATWVGTTADTLIYEVRIESKYSGTR